MRPLSSYRVWTPLLAILCVFSVSIAAVHLLTHQEGLLTTLLGQVSLLIVAVVFSGYAYHVYHRIDYLEGSNLVGFRAVILYLFAGGASGIYSFHQYLSEVVVFPLERLILDAIFVACVGGIVGLRLGVEGSQRDDALSRLRTERDRFSSLFHNIDDPIVEYSVVDRTVTIEAANEAFEEKFELEPPMSMAELDDVIIPTDRKDSAERLREAMLADESVEMDILRHTAEGRRWFRILTVPRDGGGFAILTDITELRTIREQLHVLHRVLRHNLRNRLNVARGYATLVAERVENERLYKHAERIENNIESLLDTAERIRESRERLEENPPKPEVTEVTSIVAEKVQEARSAYSDAEFDLSCPDESHAIAHPVLSEVVWVLLENAVEHNDKPTPEVDVEIERGPEMVTVRITDNGPGLPEQERVALETAKEPVPTAHASGVDLWMARWFVEQFGGTLRAREGDTEGATFEIEMRRPNDPDSEPVSAAA